MGGGVLLPPFVSSEVDFDRSHCSAAMTRFYRHDI